MREELSNTPRIGVFNETFTYYYHHIFNNKVFGTRLITHVDTIPNMISEENKNIC
jgi:hypothetical protein